MIEIIENNTVLVEVSTSSAPTVEVFVEDSTIVEVLTGAKGEAFRFEDLTEAQIIQLQSDSIPTASEIQINSLAALNDTLSATNVQSALEQIETKTIYGGAF